MKHSFLTLPLLVSLAVAGCKKKDDAAGTPPAAATPPAAGTPPAGDKPAAPPAAAGATAWVPVPSLGVTLEVPADAKADGSGGTSFMITSDSSPDCTVM